MNGKFVLWTKSGRKKRNSWEEPFKSSKFKIWLKHVVICRKYSLTKFANFLTIVLRAEIVITFSSKTVTISAYDTLMRNFVRLYLSHITTFFDQILEFTSFKTFFSGNSFFSFQIEIKVGL